MDPSYQLLADKLHRQIEARTYLPGDRLPSVRELAKDHGFSLETVLHAFRLLENKGIVEARVRSGFYVREPKLRLVAAPTKTQTIFRAKDVAVSALRHQTVTFGTSKQVVPLGLSLLGSGVLPARKLAQTAASAARRNPLGYSLSTKTKQDLVRLLARFGVPLIEDDIFGELHRPESERPKVAKTFDPDGSVILIGSFSKTLAPGLRVGWIVPGKFHGRVLELKSSTSLATATLPQLTVAEFLKFGSFDAHLRRLRKFLAEQVYRFSSAVAESFPLSTRISRPSGGFLLWIELEEDFDALQLAADALNKFRIAVAPGNIFSATGERYRNCFRISCGHAFSPRFSEAIQTLGRLATRSGAARKLG